MSKKEYRDFTEKELKWIKSLQRLMKKAPSSLFMFVGDGITILPLDEHGERYLTEFGGMDSCDNNEISIQTPMDYDGGDW